METIYKYPLDITDEQTVMMPCTHKILSAQIQKGSLYVWAWVDTNSTEMSVKFAVVGTGNPIPFHIDPDKCKFISTVQDGSFVWHIFEVED